ncbi:hypothetical protein ABKV19_026735 [Rosa sericea]
MEGRILATIFLLMIIMVASPSPSSCVRLNGFPTTYTLRDDGAIGYYGDQVVAATSNSFNNKEYGDVFATPNTFKEYYRPLANRQTDDDLQASPDAWRSLAKSEFNVMNYGAVGNGQVDDTQAFLKAWGDVCGSTQGIPTLIIPKGNTFLLNSVEFKGPCRAASVNFQAQDYDRSWEYSQALLYLHKVIGVSAFFLFVEGKAASPEVSKVLESIPGVKLIYRTKELEEQQARSRIWNETWLSSFFYKPCNYELFVKQSLNMEMAIVMARDAGMDWIIHLDTDELLHPAGAKEYSLRQLLLDVPGNVDMVIFSNYESSVERDDIKEPFTEVSMFKKNYDHVPKDTYFGMYKESTRGNPNYFLTYGNGKSAARIQDHLRPNGAHRWHNYMKTPNEIKLEEAAVLHYTYAKFSDLTSRRDRCVAASLQGKMSKDASCWNLIEL